MIDINTIKVGDKVSLVKEVHDELMRVNERWPATVEEFGEIYTIEYIAEESIYSEEGRLITVSCGWEFPCGCLELVEKSAVDKIREIAETVLNS